MDELDRIDEAFAGNRLLSTFAADARALIEPHGELIELHPGDVVLTRGEQVMATLFPAGSLAISLAVEILPAFTKASVLVGGPALRVPMEALEDAKRRSSFIGNLFCRFSDYLLAQVMQSVACNAFHSIEQRAARWLLHAQDRAGDRIELTQEAFAGLLGVQRTTVNAVIRTLQDQGAVATGRGVVRVTDRAGLKRHACECYQRLEDHFTAVIGATGSGA